MSISNDNNTIEQKHSLMQNIKNDQQNYTIYRKKGARSKIVPRHKTLIPTCPESLARIEERKNEEVYPASGLLA